MYLFNLKKSLVFLYICLVALLAVVTFVEHVHGTEFVEKYVYHTVWFCCLWGVLAALAVAVLVKRQLWRRLPTLLLHGSFLVILVGGVAIRGLLRIAHHSRRNAQSLAALGDRLHILCHIAFLPPLSITRDGASGDGTSGRFTSQMVTSTL